jgi:hypothetical protein
MDDRVMNKFHHEKEFHSWIASGFYGDTIIDVCKTKQNLINLEKDEVVYHTGKQFWHPNSQNFFPANANVLNFLNSVRFVKGLIFDFHQRDFSASIDNSNYNIEFVDLPPMADWENDIREDVDIDLFPQKFNAGILQNEKVAVLHPISLTNKPPEEFEEYYLPVWKETVRSLKGGGYKIILIGGEKDNEAMYKYYPYLLHDYEILNLIGKLTFFESLDLIWNYSKLNVSCCSWTAWYSKAAGIKTAMAGGHGMVNDVMNIRSYKYKLVGNDNCCIMDFANKKEECDKNLADWIDKL